MARRLHARHRRASRASGELFRLPASATALGAGKLRVRDQIYTSNMAIAIPTCTKNRGDIPLDWQYGVFVGVPSLDSLSTGSLHQPKLCHTYRTLRHWRYLQPDHPRSYAIFSGCTTTNR